MKTIPLARIGLILPIINFLEQIGFPTESYLNKAKIPLLASQDSETLLPLPTILKLLADIARKEGIENLGIAVAKRAKISETGMFGYLIFQSLNTYDLVKRICHFIRQTVSTNGEKLWLIEEEENLWLCQTFAKPLHAICGIDHSWYYSLILMLDCLRIALGSDWQPPNLYLPNHPYKGLQEQLKLENTRLHYHQPFIAICIPRKLLSIPVNNSQKNKIIPPNLNLPEWESTAPALDFVGSLKQTVKTLLLEKYPTIDITAEVSGLRVRTLQRYLSQQNLTYSQLMAKVRYEWAVSLLNNPDISLIEISYTLGFKDPANFSHSFRRWTGMSPSQFRKYSLST